MMKEILGIAALVVWSIGLAVIVALAVRKYRRRREAMRRWGLR